MSYPADHAGFKTYSINDKMFILPSDLHFLNIFKSNVSGSRCISGIPERQDDILKRLIHRENDTSEERSLYKSGGEKIDQLKYCNEMLYEFGMNRCSPASTPIGSGVELFTSSDEPVGHNELHGSMVNPLMHLERPDLSFIVNILDRFVVNPLNIHMIKAQRVLRYAKITKDSYLIYKSGGDR